MWQISLPQSQVRLCRCGCYHIYVGFWGFFWHMNSNNLPNPEGASSSMKNEAFITCIFLASTPILLARRWEDGGSSLTSISSSSTTKLTLVLLNPDIPCLCKQFRSRSVGFWRIQMIWICTICHSLCEFISTIWIKESDWLTIRNGCGILIYSAWQGLILLLQKVTTDLDLQCLSFSMWICINYLDQAIWLADMYKWARHLNSCSMTRVNLTN